MSPNERPGWLGRSIRRDRTPEAEPLPRSRLNVEARPGPPSPARLLFEDRREP